MIDIRLDASLVHRRQDSLNGLRMRQLVELGAAVDTSQLQDERKPKVWVRLDEGLYVGGLQG